MQQKTSRIPLPENDKRIPEHICHHCKHTECVGDGAEAWGTWEYYWLGCKKQKMHDFGNIPMCVDLYADPPNEDGTVDIIIECEGYEK